MEQKEKDIQTQLDKVTNSFSENPVEKQLAFRAKYKNVAT